MYIMYQFTEISGVIKSLCKEYFAQTDRGSLSLIYGDLIEDISSIMNLVPGESFYFAVRPYGFEGSHFVTSLKFRLSSFGIHSQIYKVTRTALNEYVICPFIDR